MLHCYVCIADCVLESEVHDSDPEGQSQTTGQILLDLQVSGFCCLVKEYFWKKGAYLKLKQSVGFMETFCDLKK